MFKKHSISQTATDQVSVGYRAEVKPEYIDWYQRNVSQSCGVQPYEVMDILDWHSIDSQLYAHCKSVKGWVSAFIPARFIAIIPYVKGC